MSATVNLQELKKAVPDRMSLRIEVVGADSPYGDDSIIYLHMHDQLSRTRDSTHRGITFDAANSANVDVIKVMVENMGKELLNARG